MAGKVIDGLPSAVRLPLRGLIAVGVVLLSLVVFFGVLWGIVTAGDAIYKAIGLTPIAIFFSIPVIYLVLAYIGDRVEDDWR